MSEGSKRFWRGGGRALVGVLIIAVSVAVALALGTGVLPTPAIERGVVSTQVDTGRSSQLTLVCTGAFAELGADPTQPGKAVPGGETLLAVAGDAHDTSELSREIPVGSTPLALTAQAGAALAAAELQLVQTQTLQGLSTSSCAEPVHEQWLVGGGSALGVSTTLVLGNPFAVPATVEVTVFDQNGRIDAQQTAGVLVPAASQRIVSINGYAPARERLAVRVSSTGAAVTAALGVSQTVDIRSFAVDTVTRQIAAATTLIVPGVTNALAHEHHPDEGIHETSEFPVTVRLLAPGQAGGSAQIFALMPGGGRELLGSLDVEREQVTEFAVPHWPEEALGVVIEATVPMVAGVMGSADLPPLHDYAWFTPAPLLPASSEAAVAVAPGGELVLVNPGEAEATAALTPEAGGAAVRVTVPAGGAVSVPALDGGYSLRASAPLAAGVRVVSGAMIAGYPVLVGTENAPTITVYTR